MKKCFIYYRVSSEKQTEKSGIERQEDTLRAYVERTGLCASMDESEAIEIHDSGVSAFKGINTSSAGQLGQWMDQVRAGMWDGSSLVVESIDRFSRQNPFTVMGYINELVSHQVTIHDVSLNMQINLANSALLPMVTMSAQRAYEESKLKSDRIRAGWAKKREQAFNKGTIVTNKRPAWIDVEDNRYVLNAKAEVVREIFRLYQTGLGTPTIAKILNERGSEWLLGRSVWRGEAVHKILRNRRVTGLISISEIIRDYNSTETPMTQKKYEMDVYPPVISTDEFELVQKMLVSRRSNAGRITGTENLVKNNIFSGVFRCATCGSVMYHNVVQAKRKPKNGDPKVEEYRYIRCMNERDGLCDNKSLRYEVLERFLIEHIRGLDFNQIIKPDEVNPQIELIRVQIEEEIKHIQEYEHGIERLKNSNRKIPFDVLTELEDSRARLNELQESASVFEEVHVDIDTLVNVDTNELYDVSNIEVRSRMERELSKILDTISLNRTGKQYVCTITYRSIEVIKHVLMITASKEPILVSNIGIFTNGDEVQYVTPSFGLITNGEIRLSTWGEPLSIVDYSLLLNYVDGIKGSEVVANWMRNNFNFISS